VKAVELVAVPPGVVISIFPVFAGTIAVTCVSESTVNPEVCIPTAVVCARLTPLMVTMVPIGPLVGKKLVICGITWNVWLLVSVVEPVVTVSGPERAPAGTTVVMEVVPTSLTVVASTSPNLQRKNC
jgi:hypothetical protein